MGISELLGKTLTECTGQVGGDEIYFCTTDGDRFKLYHEQDCCENVTIEDICGDLEDLVGAPITQAEESSNHEEHGDDSMTWTFYRMATAKGQVVIRWFGTSNGYYSERVDFKKLRRVNKLTSEA